MNNITMNKFCIAALCMSALGACSTKTEANLQDLTVGMNNYLQKKGDLCLAKNVWPIDVTQRDMDAGARNAVQMPVLEKIGLVTSTIATVEVKDEDRIASINVKRYDLTDAGKKYYLIREVNGANANGGTVPQQDFCVAKLSLDKVVKWEGVKGNNDQHNTVVTYTYKIDAAPWTSDAEVRKVFPVVTRIVQGAGTEQLQESFTKTARGWVANDL